jgi:hypothetical protein
MVEGILMSQIYPNLPFTSWLEEIHVAKKTMHKRWLEEVHVLNL